MRQEMYKAIIYKVGDKLHVDSRLTFICDVYSDKYRKALFNCECGSTFTGIVDHVKRGNTKSCGCYNAKSVSERMKKHGMCRTSIYGIWCNMINRCTNPNDANYKNYGGRGISVCDEWRNSFDAFYADMGDKPRNMSIDRDDNDGNYEASNCRWATQLQQSRNRRTNANITFNDKTQCIVDWANDIGIHRRTLNNRINNGWSIDRALTTPCMGKQ